MDAFNLPSPVRGTPAVIAHLGVNHDGSLTRAVALIEMAAACGAQAVVLPLYHSEMCRGDAFSGFCGPLPALGLDRETLRFCELGAAAVSHCVGLARMRGLKAGLQPGDAFSLEMGRELAPDFLLLDLQLPDAPALLETALGSNLPLAVQLGEADTGDLEHLRTALGRHHNRVLVMHGAQLAPVTDDCASPDRVELLGRYFTRRGYCDHGSSVACALAAAAAGAQAVAVHVTLDRGARGTCHHWALDRPLLTAYVAALRTLKPVTPTGRPLAAAPGRWWEHRDEHNREPGDARP